MCENTTKNSFFFAVSSGEASRNFYNEFASSAICLITADDKCIIVK